MCLCGEEHLLILSLLLNFSQLVHVVSRCKAAAGSVIMTSCLLRLLPPTHRLQLAMWSCVHPTPSLIDRQWTQTYGRLNTQIHTYRTHIIKFYPNSDLSYTPSRKLTRSPLAIGWHPRYLWVSLNFQWPHTLMYWSISVPLTPPLPPSNLIFVFPFPTPVGTSTLSHTSKEHGKKNLENLLVSLILTYIMCSRGAHLNPLPS